MRIVLFILSFFSVALAHGSELKHNLGIVVGSTVYPLIESGTKLPVSKKERFSTSQDGQTAVFLQVGQEVNGKIEPVTQFDVYGIPHKPAGQSGLTVEFILTKNSQLKISVLVDDKDEFQVYGPFQVK